MSLFNSVTFHDHLVGNTYTLMVDQSIKIIEKDRRLLTPLKMSSNGSIVEDFSRQSKSKGIRIRQYNFFPQSGIEFILGLSGVISYLPVRTPIREELIYCEEIKVTSGDVAWDPNYDGFDKY